MDYQDTYIPSTMSYNKFYMKYVEESSVIALNQHQHKGMPTD